MKKAVFGLFCLCLVVSLAAVFMTGCEEAAGLEILFVNPPEKEMKTRESFAWFHVSFPTSVDVTQDTTSTGTVTIAETTYTYVDDADLLRLPLEWKVTDSSLGMIYGAGGADALYMRYSKTGINTLIVRDQYGNEGYATIRQMVEQYRLALSASPATIPVGSLTSTITVSNTITGGVYGDDDKPTAPFTWTTLFPTRGYILAGQGSDTVVYRSTSDTGFNVVQCTDAYGVVGTIVITMEE